MVAPVAKTQQPPDDWLAKFVTPPVTLQFGALVRLALVDAVDRFGWFSVENLGVYLAMFFNHPDRFEEAYAWWESNGPISLLSEQWEGFCAIVADVINRY